MSRRADRREQTPYHRLTGRALRRRAGKPSAAPLTEQDWRAWAELNSTRLARLIHRVLKSLPRDPRCRLCGAPFAGVGGSLVGPLGYRPSRKNPSICATCVESSPPGGTTMTVGVMFADVRDFTARAERLDPSEASALLRRFYACAERVLLPDALIDKLIGDEVMALYIPQYVGSDSPAEVMVEHAQELRAAVGHGAVDGPFVELGIGLDYGEAFVGNIGDRAIYDFTAVGDVVNTAARLQAEARPGEIVMSERVARQLPTTTGSRVELSFKGKESALAAYRLPL